MHVWSLAKVFHTCGKNCGKSSETTYGLQVTGVARGVVSLIA